MKARLLKYNCHCAFATIGCIYPVNWVKDNEVELQSWVRVDTFDGNIYEFGEIEDRRFIVPIQDVDLLDDNYMDDDPWGLKGSRNWKYISQVR